MSKINKVVMDKVVTGSIILFVVIATYLVFETTKNIETKSIWERKIEKLSFINKEIDLYISSKISFTNYDYINNKVQEVRNILDEIKTSKNLTNFMNSSDSKLAFEVLNSTMLEKIKIIENFNSANANLSSILSDLSENLPYTKYILFNTNIYVELSGGGVVKIESEKLSHKIDNKLRDEHSDSPDKNFLLKARLASNQIDDIKSLRDSISNLGIHRLIDNFKRSLNVFFQDSFNELLTIIFLNFCMLIFFVVRRIKLFKENIKLNTEYKKLESIIKNSFSSIITTDENNKINFVNERYINTSGNTKAIGTIPDLFQNSVWNEEYYPNIKKALDNNEIWENEAVHSKTSDGKRIFERVAIFPYFDEFDKPAGNIIMRLDMTEQHNKSSDLERQTRETTLAALTDKLTGLGNHVALMNRIDSGEDGIIIFVNINQFTNLRFFYKNDEINNILVEFAKAIGLAIDDGKINALLYRYQFDEFCLWYKGSNIKSDLDKIVKFLKNSDTKMVKFSRYTNNTREIISNFSVTFGVSSAQDTKNIDRLQQAMLAHREARFLDQSVHYYTTDSLIEKQYQKNQQVTTMIKKALDDNNVIVECQGIFDVKIGENPIANRYEILIRILDSKGKIHYPGSFLDVAKKQASLYLGLTKRVIEIAFELIEIYPNKGFSINLSSIDMVNESVKELFIKKLEVCTRPYNLCVEILESEGIDDYNEINPFISKIKSYGCKLAIDDFGSGYSNYYRMLELDIDYLKIDGSIIKNLPVDENARSVVETLVAFANKQGYDVVAEFVSDEEILKYVRGYGIKYAQGFLLGKPTLPENLDLQ